MKNRRTYSIIGARVILLVYLVSIFKVFQPFIDYKINYEYISEVLCINKEKPSLNCNGKCHLKKELDKAAKEEKKNTQLGTNLEILFYDEPAHNEIAVPSLIGFGTIQVPSGQLIFESADSENAAPPPRA